MKVSKSQKDKIRKDLISSAVALFVEKGFQAATMREISTQAGYSPGTVYKYFSSKDKLFYAYFETSQEALLETVGDIDAFDTFSLKEKLQTLLEIQLETYLPDREFVEIAFKALMDSPMKSFSALRETKNRFAQTVETYIAAATESSEVPPQPFERFLSHLFWDFKNTIILYWLKDDSEEFVNTSRLIDMSLDVYVAVVQSGMVTKAADVALFLLKSHLFGNMDRLFNLVGILGAINPGENTGGVA